MDLPTAQPTVATNAALRRHGPTQLFFAAAISASALLMFLVQPMVGKAVLPALGGTPQVWNTCMVFFQAMLFAGYLYAHYLGVWLGGRRQAVVHLLLAAGALLMIPFGVSAVGLATPDTERPIVWLMQLLVLSVGAPVFVISATAPLLQKWFARSGHPAAHDPYFLYAASNAGSLIALLAYPTIVEPFSTVGQQWMWWSAGFGLLAVLLLVCASLVRQGMHAGAVRARPATASLPAPIVTIQTRVRWVLLAFAPSSLLLGLTTYITTDVAAVPLFWVVPLALYLLTFIIAFSRKPVIAPHIALRAQALALTLVAVLALVPAIKSSMAAGSALTHLVCFFLTALVCHGELVRARPHVRHLTEFYLFMSLGGLLGGVFNALIAPVVFMQLLEYPLVIMLACALRPVTGTPSSSAERFLDVLLPASIALLGWVTLRGTTVLPDLLPPAGALSVLTIMLVGVAVGLLSFSPRRLRFALGVGALLGAATLQGGGSAGSRTLLFQDRSFFGMVRVLHDQKLGANMLIHGSTAHGIQRMDAAKPPEPATYYHRAGPYGQMFDAAAPVVRDRPVAVVGLGAGSLACYGQKGSSWTFFEIDPLVERVARDERLFTFLRDCPPVSEVVIGDARVTLRNAADHGYAMIIIDAFTSDSIPTHLLTREAIAAYRNKLSPDGLIALHISNRHLKLGPVVGNLARDAGLVGRISSVTPSSDGTLLTSPAELVVLATNEAHLGPLTNHPKWLPLPMDAGARVWSDDHVNILRAYTVFESRRR